MDKLQLLYIFSMVANLFFIMAITAMAKEKSYVKKRVDISNIETDMQSLMVCITPIVVDEIVDYFLSNRNNILENPNKVLGKIADPGEDPDFVIGLVMRVRQRLSENVVNTFLFYHSGGNKHFLDFLLSIFKKVSMVCVKWYSVEIAKMEERNKELLTNTKTMDKAMSSNDMRKLAYDRMIINMHDLKDSFYNGGFTNDDA